MAATEVEMSQTQDLFGDGNRMSDAREAKKLSAELDRLTKQLKQLEEEYFSREA